MRSAWFVLAIPILSFMTIRVANAEICPVESATEREVVAFLEAAESDNSVPADCIIVAINKLYKVRSKKSIDILVQYLDYRRPMREPEVATGSNSEPYPAVSQLFAAGRPALPALVRVLWRTESSKVAHDNALRTIMLIYRDDPPAGVKFLMEEAAKLRNGGESGKSSMLRQAAYDGMRWCSYSDRYRENCEAALSSSNP